MENKDNEGNKETTINKGPKETYPNEKPQAPLYDSTPEKDYLESMEVDNGALRLKVNKN